MFLRDAPGFSQGFLFWGVGTWRCQRILAEAMFLPSCTNGNHHITVTHLLPLPLGFCTPSSLHKTMPGDQEQGYSWEPWEFMTFSLKEGPKLKGKSLGAKSLEVKTGSYSAPLRSKQFFCIRVSLEFFWYLL